MKKIIIVSVLLMLLILYYVNFINPCIKINCTGDEICEILEKYPPKPVCTGIID